MKDIIMGEKAKKVFRVLLAILVIGAALMLTVRFIKMLPPLVKFIGIIANIATVYFFIDWIRRKNKITDESDNQ